MMCLMRYITYNGRYQYEYTPREDIKRSDWVTLFDETHNIQIKVSLVNTYHNIFKKKNRC